MTISFPSHRPGDVPPFRGAPAEKAANRLSHAWERKSELLPSAVQLRFPQSWLDELTAEGEDINEQPVHEWGECKVCGAEDDKDMADWPCGEAPRLGPDEYYWGGYPRD